MAEQLHIQVHNIDELAMRDFERLFSTDAQGRQRRVRLTKTNLMAVLGIVPAAMSEAEQRQRLLCSLRAMHKAALYDQMTVRVNGLTDALAVARTTNSSTVNKALAAENADLKSKVDNLEMVNTNLKSGVHHLEQASDSLAAENADLRALLDSSIQTNESLIAKSGTMGDTYARIVDRYTTIINILYDGTENLTLDIKDPDDVTRVELAEAYVRTLANDQETISYLSQEVRRLSTVLLRHELERSRSLPRRVYRRIRRHLS